MRILWSELLFDDQTALYLIRYPKLLEGKEGPGVENGAWTEHSGRVAQLLPSDDFLVLSAYYFDVKGVQFYQSALRQGVTLETGDDKSGVELVHTQLENLREQHDDPYRMASKYYGVRVTSDEVRLRGAPNDTQNPYYG